MNTLGHSDDEDFPKDDATVSDRELIKELDRGLSEYLANPSSAIPASDVIAELRRRQVEAMKSHKR